MKTWTVDEVMTREVMSVGPTASYRSLVDLLISNHFSAVPVVDDFRRVLGVVSEADLLRKIEYAGDEQPRLFESRNRRGDRAKSLAATAAELMTTPPVAALAGTTIVAAARLMDSEGVKRLPVVDDLGRLVGIVTRSDLLKVHLRPDDDIRDDITVNVLRVFLIEESSAVQVEVAEGVVTLTGRVDRWTTAELTTRLARRIAGVVEVVDKLGFDVDDRRSPAIGPFNAEM